MRPFKLLAMFLLTGGLLLVGGCDSFIERDPQEFTSSGEFYSNPDEVEQGVAGIYGELQEIYDADGGRLWAAAEMRSDNTDFQFNSSDRGSDQLEAFDRFNIAGAGNILVESLWADIYQGVSQANTVLNRIDDVNFDDETQRDRLRGEAQFLRGFLYYHLVQLWGRGDQGVPLVLREVRSGEGAQSDGRASVSNVYAQIVTDAENAIANLPPASPGDGDATRATKPAARMLLASARMAQGDFGGAVSPLQTVVNNSGHALVEDYADVFDPDNKGNAEMIFSIGYADGVASGAEASSWIYVFAPFNSGLDLVYGIGNGVTPSGSGFNLPTPSLISEFSQGSERETVAIGYYENPDNAAYDVAVNNDEIPYIEKFRHPFSEPEQTRENWPVYRFAEAKLLLAEALLQSGGNAGEAAQQVNDVRDRVSLPLISGVTLEDVYREQRVELAFENKRWYQLRRRGIAVETLRAHAQDQLSRLSPSSLTSGAYSTIADHQVVLPVPEREVRLNDLEQTQGWVGSN